MSAVPRSQLPRLMMVLDVARVVDWDRTLESLEQAVTAGLRWVQLRDKRAPDRELTESMRLLDRHLPTGVLRSLNGRPQLAARFGWGLHLPASAACPESAGYRCLGRSVHDSQETDRCRAEPLDYLVAGTLFPTDSKRGVHGSGLAGLESILPSAGGRPVLGIGGIDAAGARGVRLAGGWGVAVFGAIHNAADPAKATQELLQAVSD